MAATGLLCVLILGSISSSFTVADRPCDCGWKNQNQGGLQIHGGEEAQVNEFPYMAVVIDVVNNEARCGASIISDRYALTAAHCLYSRKTSELGLLVGAHKLSNISMTPYAKHYWLTWAMPHPDFDISTMVNDIAILQTRDQIEFSVHVGPVCLPFRYPSALFEGLTVTAAGWGLLDFGGRKSDTLQKVDLGIVTNENCSAQMTSETITPGHICSFAPNKDTCQFDSGGPLWWFDSRINRNYLVGIVSYGRGCGWDTPSVNTRITSYLSWIYYSTLDATYCAR